MQFDEAEKFIIAQLASIYDADESRNIALLVLEHSTGLLPAAIKGDRQQVLTPGQSEIFKEAVRRLQLHEPIQYIMQKTWFYGLELFVDKNVLIPRPETEELVDWIVQDMKASHKNFFEKGKYEADATTQLKILDIGTGSGCIALAIKKTLPLAEVWGCDVSEAALNIARRNGATTDVRVDFQGVDFLDEKQQTLLPTADIIISNPPYIPQGESAEMQLNVLNHEPHGALFVPDADPLLFYKAIVHFAAKRLYPNGAIYLELHEKSGEAVQALFGSDVWNTTLKKDMQGKVRMLKATRH